MRLYFLKNNNKRRRKIISLFFVVFIFVFTNIFSNYSYVSAAFNKQINYQGKLTDGSNMAVANGTYNMEFKLYTSSGSNIWTETRTGGNRVQVTNGLFSVMLGEVSSLSGVDFNQTLTLGVNIGGLSASPSWDGEMTPRKSLGTVPSAVVSETVTNAAQPAITSVGTLTGLTMGGNLQVGGHTLQFDNTGVRSWSMGVNALNLNISSGDGLGGLTFNNNTVWHAGNDGTGSTLDADLLDGHDTSYFQTALTNPTTGTGTANYLTKFTGATTLASSLIYDNGTRIGISTNNPSALLDVNGSSLFRNTLSVADTATRAYSNFGSNSTSHGLSNPADVLFSGNVEIDGNLYLDASTIQLSSTSISSDLQVDGVLKLSDGTALNPSYTFKNDTDTGLFRGGTNILGLTTAGAERMRIDADGNVGIGTTSPVTKAHITGTLTVDPGSGSNYSEGIRIASASDGYSVVNFGSNPTSGTGWQSNQWWIGKDGRDNGFNIFSGAGYDVFHINNSGNVGIGTTTPGYKLDVNGSINIGNLASGSDAILHFSSNAAGGTRRITYRAATAAISIDDTGGSALMTILNNGNVGIGTTSPGTKLDVSGGAIRTDNQLISTVATGTSPLSVSSSTLVSNLNADLLDGLHASGSVGANTIVTRDSNGYIYANYINSNVGYENSSAASYFYETGDGYLRKKSLANVRAELGGSSSGLNADLLDGLSSADFIQTSTDQSRSGKLQLYATDTSGSYHTRAIELREVGLSITAHSGDQNYAPALGFHWGGVNQAILSMHSNGQFYMTNDGVSGGTGLSTLNANIVASSVTVNGNSVWHAGNDGAGSGLDADLLDGINLGSISNNNGNIWGTIPVVKGDGVTEIGKYLDFHNASNDGIDYNNRITSNDGYLNLSGGLVISGAVTGAGESLKLGGIRGSYTNDYIHMYNKVGIGDPTGWGNGESSTPDKGLSVYGGANLAIGQGNVGIGTTSPKGKLHIVNNSVVNEENTGGINISSGVASTNAKLILGAVGDSYSYL